MLFALVSPPVFFAAERGNVDLLMFALTMVVVVLIDRAYVFRLVAYAAAEAGAFLKYYPLSLVALASRERPTRAIVIVLMSLLAFALYIWSDFDLIRKIYRAVPVVTSKTDLTPVALGSVWYSGDGFGADLLTQVVTAFAVRQLGAQLPSAAFKLPLVAAAAAMAFILGRRPAMSRALNALSPRELHCLIAGSLIICFCFFSGSNVGYRAIFLLPVVPGLIAAAKTLPARRASFAWALMTDAVLILIWTMPTDLSSLPVAPLDFRRLFDRFGKRFGGLSQQSCLRRSCAFCSLHPHLSDYTNTEQKLT